jgi:hypothetical protein
MRIPGQIDRQQPVYLIDALGRHRPLHLEFIRSPEVRNYSILKLHQADTLQKALSSVLQSTFRLVGSGAKKIQLGEYVLQDSVTKREINLSDPWETTFCPGQTVVMSMVFESTKLLTRFCPKCGQVNSMEEMMEDVDIEWLATGAPVN